MNNKNDSTWVDTLPVVGTQCEKCMQGYLVDATFMSKKGVKWEKVFCPSCKHSWLKSQSKRKGGSSPLREGDQGAQILQGQDKILAAIKIVNENIKVALGVNKQPKQPELSDRNDDGTPVIPIVEDER